MMILEMLINTLKHKYSPGVCTIPLIFSWPLCEGNVLDLLLCSAISVAYERYDWPYIQLWDYKMNGWTGKYFVVWSTPVCHFLLFLFLYLSLICFVNSCLTCFNHVISGLPVNNFGITVLDNITWLYLFRLSRYL